MPVGKFRADTNGKKKRGLTGIVGGIHTTLLHVGEKVLNGIVVGAL
jgi:hypothetical protein